MYKIFQTGHNSYSSLACVSQYTRSRTEELDGFSMKRYTDGFPAAFDEQTFRETTIGGM